MTATLQPGLRGPRGRGAARRARADARPLPAVLRARVDRRLRGHPVQRPVQRRLRPLRRDGRRPHASPRRPATLDLGSLPGQRRRPRPAPAGPRLGGRLRRHHLGDRPGASRARGRRRTTAWRWPSFDAGADAMRTLAQAGLLPTVLRLSDETETAINLADPTLDRRVGATGGCLMITGYEGTADAGRRAPRAAVTDAARRPRRHRARRGARRRRGCRAASTRPTSATPCSTSACSSRPSRRRPSGPTASGSTPT